MQFWGITGVQKEAVLAAHRSVVTVEEIVDELDPGPARSCCRRGWYPTSPRPGGSHPSYALDYSVRDNDFYVAWDAISRDRASFQAWLDEHVFAAASPAGHGRER